MIGSVVFEGSGAASSRPKAGVCLGWQGLEFPKTRGTILWVLIIRVLLCRVLYWGRKVHLIWECGATLRCSKVLVQLVT